MFRVQKFRHSRGLVPTNHCRPSKSRLCFVPDFPRKYKSDLEIDVDFSEAALNDDLNGTVDYSQLNKIIRAEMAIKSRLIEHVANRIATRILDEFPDIESGTLSVAKQNPPVQGEMESVEVVIEL